MEGKNFHSKVAFEARVPSDTCPHISECSWCFTQGICGDGEREKDCNWVNLVTSTMAVRRMDVCWGHSEMAQWRQKWRIRLGAMHYRKEEWMDVMDNWRWKLKGCWTPEANQESQKHWTGRSWDELNWLCSQTVCLYSGGQAMVVVTER